MKTGEMRLYGDRVYGIKVSDYGLENGYLDYHTLAKIVGDCILNNEIFGASDIDDWEIINGDWIIENEIYQFYIISDYGAEFLIEHTDEIVFYNEKLDLYLWGITHFGTAWDYVLTDIKLVRD